MGPSMSAEAAKYSPIAASFLLIAVCAWIGYSAYPSFEDYIRFLIRETAYISTTFFLAAYLARPLLSVTASDFARTLVRVRRQIGLAAALAHTVHFAVVVALFRFTGESVDPITFVFGGMGFVMFWLLAATSNDASVRWLGATNWKRLHRVGIHYIWFIFMQIYLSDAFAQPIYWVFVAALGLGLALRIRIFMSQRAAAAA